MVDLFSFGDEKLDLSTRQQIDEVCIAFEDAWKSEERPSVEEFITRLPETARRSLFRELLLVELDYRRRLGEEPRSEEYQSRFPGFEKVVASVFDKPPLSRTSRATPVHASQQDTLTITTSSKSAESSSDAGQNLGRFELRGRLGAGGFGTVYRAYDTMLHREVALKLPHPGRFETEESRIRVLREARAAAKLYHPHIVPVHDAGVERDVFYIASAFVEGESLAQTLARREPDFDEAATIVLKLATALQYAHDQGIIHRDVKPGNVMMDADGDPRLMDFGLARFLESEDRLTHDGTILGTPAYMSPEQARGAHDRVGPASDQYSLGVVLYQSLCGDVPFAGTPATVVSDVVEKEPLAPRTVRRQIPRDLETICLKSLAKVPEERYPSCQHLADDLERWLRNEPIAARPVGFAGRAWRWCKRKPVVAALATALLLALLVGSSVSMVFGIKATRNAHDLTTALGDLGKKKAEAVTQRDRADDERRKAKDARDLAETNLYFSRIESVRRHIQDHEIAQADRLLDACPPELRHWEWGYLKRLCHLELFSLEGERKSTGPIAVSADGNRIASAVTDDAGFRGMSIWDVPTRKEQLHIEIEGLGLYALLSLAISGDGRLVAAVLQKGSARAWDAVTGQELLAIERTQEEACSCVAFSPDGNRLAVGGKTGTIDVYDMSSKEVVSTIRANIGSIQKILFSPGGKRIVIQGPGVCEFWDAAGQRIRTIAEHPNRRSLAASATSASGSLCVALSADGRRVATATPDLKIWETETGKLLWSIAGEAYHLAFSLDGTRIAGTMQESVKVWDAETGLPVTTLFGRGIGGEIAFLPDGKRVVTGGSPVRVWDLEQCQETSTLGVPSFPTILAFSEDGSRLLIGSHGSSTRVVDPLTAKLVRTVGSDWRFAPSSLKDVKADGDWMKKPANPVAFSRDGSRMAELRLDNSLKLWDVDNGSELNAVTLEQVPLCVALSSAGDRVAIGTYDSKAEIRDVKTGKCLHLFEAQSPWLVDYHIAAFDAELKRREAELDEEKAAANRQFISHWKDGLGICDVSLSPDGRRLAAMSRAGTVKVWDVAFGKELFTAFTFCYSKQAIEKTPFRWAPHPPGMAYGPKGKTIATYGFPVKLWDAETGECQATLSGHSGEVWYAAFSSDGRRIFTGGADKTVRGWDTAMGQELISLAVPNAVNALAVSPDNRHVVCGQFGFEILMLDAAAGENLSFVRRPARYSDPIALLTPEELKTRLGGGGRPASVPAPASADAKPSPGEPPKPASVPARHPDTSTNQKAGGSLILARSTDEAPIQEIDLSSGTELTINLHIRQQVDRQDMFPSLPPNKPETHDFLLRQQTQFLSRLPNKAELRDKPQEALHAEPDYLSKTPRYGVLPIGPGPDSNVTVVVDAPQGGQMRIFFDANNDEDLTNDGGTTENSGHCCIDLSYGDRTLPYRIGYSYVPGGISFWPDEARECMIHLAGAEYRMVVVDDDGDGRYDDLEEGLLYIKGASEMSSDSSLYRNAAAELTEPFEIGGKMVHVVSMSPDGTKLTLSPYSLQELPARGPDAASGTVHTLMLEPLTMSGRFSRLSFEDTPLSKLEDKGYDALFPRFIRFVDAPQETLLTEPKYQSGRPQYGALRVGNGADRIVTVVLDAVEGKSPRLYVDANNDEDLTNDGLVGVQRESFSVVLHNDEYVKVPRYDFEDKPIDVPYASGSIPHTFRFEWTAHGELAAAYLSFATYTARQCQVECDGNVYWIMAVTENAEARFDDPDTTYLFIKQGVASSSCDWAEAVKPGEPLKLGDRKWMTASLSADGMQMTLEPFTFQELSFDKPDETDRGAYTPRKKGTGRRRKGRVDDTRTEEYVLQLEPRSTTIGGAYSIRFPQRVELTDEPLEELRSEPDYQSNHPRYGWLDLGNGPDRAVTVVLDAAEGKSPRLYVDANNDEDLTNDGPAEMQSGFGSRYHLEDKTIDVSYASGSVPYACRFWYDRDRTPDTLGYEGCTGRQCFLRCKGKEYWIFLLGSGDNARFDDVNDMYLIVKEGHKSSPPPWEDDGIKMGEPLELGGRKWQLSLISPDGMRMTLRAWTEPGATSTSDDHEEPATEASAASQSPEQSTDTAEDIAAPPPPTTAPPRR